MQFVHTLVPTFHGVPSHLSPLEGKEIRIEVNVKGYPPPKIVWYHNREPIATESSIEIDKQGYLFFPSIELKHSGVYKVRATNTSGEAEKEVTVRVMSEGCDGGEGDKSREINRPVPVEEFGTFVSEHHALGNKKFRESYEVSHYNVMRHSIL